ncbi:hypothetical protein SCOCK_90068 [Actinacidiphila cocklensis]|uniref:Uncharacterized protein n=1 Tax=Actinacidiphila cocklensis TaxID=887465 RepID=A0A9W4GWI8_9ACTN|nr:hypothetical protein SCOCK_90068 [Actinacidiphila cocklensis]
MSTTGSISLGVALVAGRKRVPRPAAGITALLIRVRVRVMRYTIAFAYVRKMKNRIITAGIQRSWMV